MNPLRPDRSRSAVRRLNPAAPSSAEESVDESLAFSPAESVGEALERHDLSGVWPVTDFSTAVVPDVYEPRYAYPLIIWLTSPECPRDRAVDHLSSISPQNYVGLAVEESLFQNPSATSGLDASMQFLQQLANIENQLVTAIRALRRRVSLHGERIFIGGAGEAAAVALLIAMHQPEWFAGCFCVGGWFPPAAELLARRQDLAGHRFWLSSSAATSPLKSSSAQSDHESNLNATRHIARRLIACGADVNLRFDRHHQSVPHSEAVSRDMLRDIDAWIINGIFAGQF